jgi:hypothetical protein
MSESNELFSNDVKIDTNTMINVCKQSIGISIQTLKDAKPNDRTELDRRFAIVITDLEKIQAYFLIYIANKDMLK